MTDQVERVYNEVQNEHDIKTSKRLFERFSSGDEISVSLIQRKCKCGYFSATRVLDKLISDGSVQGGIITMTDQMLNDLKTD
jgi:hypothetical protein